MRCRNKNENNNNIIVILLFIIIVILGVLCVLFATGTITFNSNRQINNTSDNTNTGNNEKNKEKVINKLKEALTNQNWIKDNLYSKKDCFGKDVNSLNHELKFEVLSDNNNNPIIIVSDNAIEDFIVACYKVYVSNGNVIVKSVGAVGHPSHGGFIIDKENGLVFYSYGHQGHFKFISYDVKTIEIKENEEYECNNCEYEYKGDKNFKFSDISIELNDSNVNKYIK